MILWWGTVEAETNRRCFKRTSEILSSPSHTKLVCSGRNLSYFLKHPDYKLHSSRCPKDLHATRSMWLTWKILGRSKWCSNNQDSRELRVNIWAPGRPSRATQGGLTHHTRHMQGLLSWLGKQSSRWKAPFSCLCFWHSLLFVSDYRFGVEFAFLKKNSRESLLFRHRLREKTKASCSFLSRLLSCT